MNKFEDLKMSIEDDEDITVTLTLEDDTELECAVIAIFPVKDKYYVAMIPLGEENLAVFLYRIKRSEECDVELENIDDDEEYVIAADAYNSLVDEM